MKFKVFQPIFWVLLIYSIFSISICIFLFAIANEENNWVVNSIIIFMCTVYPISLLMWSCFTMLNTIIIDESFICRYRFGKCIRRFSWDEIKSCNIGNNNFSGWTYVSTKKYPQPLSDTEMRLSRNVIYFHNSSKTQEAIKLIKAKLNILS